LKGTIAVELLEQVPALDAILVSASGGGMICYFLMCFKYFLTFYIVFDIFSSNGYPRNHTTTTR
jgi:threonine dehydratase